MANISMVDHLTFGFVHTHPVMHKSGMQGGNLFEWVTSSPHMAAACQVGLISALYVVCSRFRAHSSRSVAAPQRFQPPTPVKPMKAQRVLQLHHMFVVTPFAAFAALGCASWGARLTGVLKRRRQLKSTKKLQFEDKLVPQKYQEHEEPDVEPTVRNRRSSKLGTNDGRPLVPVKMLAPKRPVASAPDEPEDEDCMGGSHASLPGSAGFVAEQTAEVERVLEIVRMQTEGSVQLIDEDRIKELTIESQVVPDGIVHSQTVDLESRIKRTPNSLPKRVRFA